VKNHSHNIDDIYLAALDRENAAERSSYLDEACAGQPELRRRVERLLEAQAQIGSFLEAPAPELCSTVDAPPTRECAGHIIGPYKFLELIGEGGMGAVWMAEQTAPIRRRVAVKVIKAGMDSKQMLARFEAERQALALMDHPNIAKVLDAGATSAGRPYFVMELVNGTPITKYCDENRLDIRSRLELLADVCRAVQHAHQKGIIHRDIKPSNVLVAPYDGRPVVKVIDFGIAKAAGQQLTDRTLFTGFGAVVGTPEYMAPEQAETNNQDIDTRSDIYSLGVLLFELLAGSTPLTRERVKQAALFEVFRVIREEESPRPSTRLSESKDSLPSIAAQRHTEPAKLTQLLRGELDWIVMKALEKDRNRRYDTANGFAADVERFLAGEQVQAVPPSASYRLKKFLRRNGGPVIAVGVVMLVLVGGIIGTTLGLIRAVEAEGETGRTLVKVADERNAKERARADAVANALRADAEKKQAEVDRDRAKFQALRAADARHAVQMFLVQRSVETGDMTEANRVLTAVDEPYRETWEQRHLANLARRRVRELPGHTKDVRSVAISPDGARMVSVSDDNTVRVWDVDAGRELHCLKNHYDLEAVAFSRDGTRFATGGAEFVIWDATTVKKLHTIKLKAGVFGVAFSPDGRRIAAGYGHQEGAVRLWDAETGEEKAVIKIPDMRPNHVAFSPNGKLLAVASDGSNNDGIVSVWTLETGKVLQTFPKTDGFLLGLDFSPDSKFVAAAHDQAATVWDVATGKVKFTMEPTNRFLGCNSIRYSPDGGRLAIGAGDATVRVWEAGSGRELAPLSLHSDLTTYHPVDFSRDGRRLISCGRKHALVVWDLDVRPNVAFTHHKYDLYCIAGSPDSKWVATTSDTRGAYARVAAVGFNPASAGLKVWDPATGVVKHTLKYELSLINSLAVAPNGRRLAAAGGESFEGGDIQRPVPGLIKIWDPTTAEEQLSIKTKAGPFACVAFSPDGTRLLSVTTSGEIQVYDARTGDHCFTHKTGHLGIDPIHRERSRGAAFSPDGHLLAAATIEKGAPGPVAVWEVATGKKKLELPTDGVVMFVAYSPDGRRIATSDGAGTATLWDAVTGAKAATLKGHSATVVGLAFSSDSARLATSSAGAAQKMPGEIRIWNTETGEEKLVLKGHDGRVNAVYFTADGRLISAGKDLSARVWNAPK
jgi:WD40 repeat protein/serine/threonine protein kinase